MFSSAINLVRSGCKTAYPCAAVAVGVGDSVFVREFFGNRQEKPELLPITADTLFDLASLSKLVATTTVALKLIEKGYISHEDSIGKFLDYTGNYGNCRIFHLLTHTSGMPAGLPLFRMEHKNGDVLRTVLDSEKCCNTGEKVIYSCMGYIVLQRILETAGGKALDKLAEEYVFSPLGMKNACYNPMTKASELRALPIAATELYSHTGQWATGHVHDENAYFLGGVSGNAGVFATLDDMICFARMCSSGKDAKGNIYLSRETLELALKNHTSTKGEARGFGFQLKGDGNFPAGTLLSEGSFGHTGFTGTSFYTDRKTGLWGILLTNAVHCGRENREEYFSVRKRFYDMIVSEYNG